MIEINLVPDVKQELIKAQRIRTTVITITVIIGIAAVGVVVALAMYVFTVQAVRDVLLDGQVKDKAGTLNDVKDLSKTLTIQNQLTKISALNADKKIDSRIFDVLGAINPPPPNNVRISVLTVDATTNTMSMDGQALNSYAALEVFKKTISGAKVNFTGSDKDNPISLASDISTSNTSYGQDTSGTRVLKFTLSFKYPKELFSPGSKNVSIEVANKGDATDSYLGVPTSIFTVPAIPTAEGN